MLRPARAERLCPRVPSVDIIRQRGEKVFGHRPCLWQADLVRAILRGDKDVVAISGTGSGKTLTFWLPLLFCADGIQIVITPLNILGTQNRNQLANSKISAISVDAQSFSPRIIHDIAALKYRVVIVNPELALAVNGPFQELWKDRDFVSHCISVVWDEAHCVSHWSSFRKEYAEAERLRNLLVEDVPYLVTSATLPNKVLTSVMQILKMSHERTVYVLRSNDRPNVYIGVRRIQHSLKSFKDLECLVPKNWKPGDELPKFLIFFDSIQESVNAIKALAGMMPQELRDRLVWFNSDMSKGFREVMTTKFKDTNEICMLGCTDSFGLGVDVPNVTFVGQWRVTCDIDTLWQRFGRAARGHGTEGVAILFAEDKYFDDTKEKVHAAAEARKKAQLNKAMNEEKRKRERCEAAARKRVRFGIPSPPGALKHITNNSDTSEHDSITSSTVTEPNKNRTIPSDSDSCSVTAIPGSTPSSFIAVHEALRIEYAHLEAINKANTTVHSGVKAVGTIVSQIAPEMENLINAATRAFRCYRVPINAYYENDRRVSTHKECDTHTSAGCARCNVPPSPICCELCNIKSSQPSQVFTQYAPPPPMATKPQHTAPRPSPLPKFIPDAIDFELRRKLDDFRCQKMKERHGTPIACNLGPVDIMSDTELERIAACGRFRKLITLADLQRELPKWWRGEHYGEEVISIVHRYYPIDTNLFTTTPLPSRKHPHSTSTENRTSGTHSEGGKKRMSKCSACGQVGHYKSNTSCPARAVQTTGKQNLI